MEELPLRVKTAMTMRAQYATITGEHIVPWFEADPVKREAWLTIADAAIRVIADEARRKHKIGQRLILNDETSLQFQLGSSMETLNISKPRPDHYQPPFQSVRLIVQNPFEWELIVQASPISRVYMYRYDPTRIDVKDADIIWNWARRTLGLCA